MTRQTSTKFLQGLANVSDVEGLLVNLVSLWPCFFPGNTPQPQKLWKSSPFRAQHEHTHTNWCFNSYRQDFTPSLPDNCTQYTSHVHSTQNCCGRLISHLSYSQNFTAWCPALCLHCFWAVGEAGWGDGAQALQTNHVCSRGHHLSSWSWAPAWDHQSILPSRLSAAPRQKVPEVSVEDREHLTSSLKDGKQKFLPLLNERHPETRLFPVFKSDTNTGTKVEIPELLLLNGLSVSALETITSVLFSCSFFFLQGLLTLPISRIPPVSLLWLSTWSYRDPESDAGIW